MHSFPAEAAPTRAPQTSFRAKAAAASAAVGRGLVDGLLAEATDEECLQRDKVYCDQQTVQHNMQERRKEGRQEGR